MQLVGLTGGIASGKTLVSDHFASLGVPIVDADLIAREVVAVGSEGLAAVAAAFGEEMLDSSGELNRQVLRTRVFGDDAARDRLNGVLHPRIRALSDQRIEQHRADGAVYAIYAVPLLVETQQQDRFDRILVVDVPEASQVQRLITRDGIDEAAAHRILRAQATREQRLAVADDVIDNTGSLEDTRNEVERLHRLYLALASRGKLSRT